MPSIPTDNEIRSHPAFAAVLRASRLNNYVFWFGLPLFLGFGITAVLNRQPWAIPVAMVLAVVNVACQLAGFRLARKPLNEISDDAATRGRAWRLAGVDIRPRFLRRFARL